MSEVQAIADRVGIIRQGSLVEVANTADLLQRSLRRLRLRFAGPVDPAGLLAVPGVTLLGQPAPDSLLLEVAGKVDALVKALAAYPVQDIETERPSLEEVFLAYYREQTPYGGKVRCGACVSRPFFDHHLRSRRNQITRLGRSRCSSWRPIWSCCMMLSSRSKSNLLSLVSAYPPELMAAFGGTADLFTPSGFLNFTFFSYCRGAARFFGDLDGQRHAGG